MASLESWQLSFWGVCNEKTQVAAQRKGGAHTCKGPAPAQLLRSSAAPLTTAACMRGAGALSGCLVYAEGLFQQTPMKRELLRCFFCS
jgi:hypothetical protein